MFDFVPSSLVIIRFACVLCHSVKRTDVSSAVKSRFALLTGEVVKCRTRRCKILPASLSSGQ